MAPYSVRPHVCTVEVGFIGVEDHAMDGRLFAVLVVLYVLGKVSGRVDGEDVAVTRVVVERIAVHGIGRLLRWEKEDSASLGIGIVGFGYRSRQLGSRGRHTAYLRWPPIGKLPVCTISPGLLTSWELHFFIDEP
jgi:hypothetical protein